MSHTNSLAHSLAHACAYISSQNLPSSLTIPHPPIPPSVSRPPTPLAPTHCAVSVTPLTPLTELCLSPLSPHSLHCVCHPSHPTHCAVSVTPLTPLTALCLSPATMTARQCQGPRLTLPLPLSEPLPWARAVSTIDHQSCQRITSCTAASTTVTATVTATATATGTATPTEFVFLVALAGLRTVRVSGGDTAGAPLPVCARTGPTGLAHTGSGEWRVVVCDDGWWVVGGDE